MINYFVTKKHFYTLTPFLTKWSEHARKIFRIIPYENLDDINSLPEDIYIFSDLDRLDPKTMNKAAALRDRIAQKFSSDLIFNNPRLFPDRYALLNRLWSQGINDFRAHRAGLPGTGVAFPAFIRRVGDHLGPLTGLLHDEREFRQALDRLDAMGIGTDELIVIEFCDTRGEDGIFRKYSAFRIGPEIIPGHIIFSDDWVAKDNRQAPQQGETDAYLETNPHRDRLMEIFELGNVDYGRIDYGLKDGKVQVWEINTNPMLLGPPASYHPSKRPPKKVLARRLERAFLALNETLHEGRTASSVAPDRGLPRISLSRWHLIVHGWRFFLGKYLDALVHKYEKAGLAGYRVEGHRRSGKPSPSTKGGRADGGRPRKVEIRKMVPADLADVLAILKQWNMAPRPDLEDAERDSIKVDQTFVALVDGKIVGTAGYLVISDSAAETASLAVDPAYKGKGIGYQLQAARMREIRGKGFRTLRTETDRPETIRWYMERFGYRKVGVNPKKHEFSLPDIHYWTVLELDLRPAPDGRRGVRGRHS